MQRTHLDSKAFGSRYIGGLSKAGSIGLIVSASAWAAPSSDLAPAPMGTWVWYVVPAAFLLGVFGAVTIYGHMQRRRRRRTKPPKAATDSGPPQVFLVQQGDEIVRFVINKTPCRVGRSERNDLTVKHPSVSRQHAQITLRHDGLYEITDLESLNGVFVNDKKIKTAALAEGDIVDIGDLTFKFTAYEED